MGRFDVMLPCAVVTLPEADNDRVCPLWKVVISLMVHPPKIMRSHAGAVLKKNSVHKPVITKRWGISCTPLEYSPSKRL